MAAVDTSVYNVINEVVKQGLGATAVQASNQSTLVSVGDFVLQSSANTENFLNTLVMRIGKTIISDRAYRNKFSNLYRDSFEMGAILQKVKVKLIEAEEDQSYNLEDGKSVDPWVINKPKATQKLFYNESPYQFHITVQRVHLKTAFTSAERMESFISGIYTELRNSIELANEEHARAVLDNAIVKSSHTINLVTDFNNLHGTTLTAETAMYNNEFLRYAVGQIKLLSKRMTNMSSLYNDGSETRFTPQDKQRLYILADFETSLETVVQWAAFHDSFVTLPGYQEVTYWQGQENPLKVVTDEGTVNNVIGVLSDWDSFGIFKHDEWSATTPLNPAGGYYQVYQHYVEGAFVDPSENFVTITLN